MTDASESVLRAETVLAQSAKSDKDGYMPHKTEYESITDVSGGGNHHYFYYSYKQIACSQKICKVKKWPTGEILFEYTESSILSPDQMLIQTNFDDMKFVGKFRDDEFIHDVSAETRINYSWPFRDKGVVLKTVEIWGASHSPWFFKTFRL
jgi:hypothetical protein